MAFALCICVPNVNRHVFYNCIASFLQSKIVYLLKLNLSISFLSTTSLSVEFCKVAICVLNKILTLMKVYHNYRL
mgnify:CR=1 FL=1